MKSHTTCILCKTEGEAVTLNSLAMHRCFKCGLVWRDCFDVPPGLYEESRFNLSGGKIEERLRNCKDRIALFSKYIELHNVCDIGCGEGIFLKALIEAGYSGGVGVEPNKSLEAFKTEHGLEIFEGTIDDACTVVENKGIKIFTLFHVIEHLRDPVGAMRGLMECMQSGDHLIIETPDINSYLFRASGYRHPLIYEEHLFYFNRKNLRMLLEKCGGICIAQGKRGFDDKHAGIRSSLERLGLVKYQHGRDNDKFDQHPNGVSIAESAQTGTAGFRGWFRSLIRSALARVVVWLNRTDYQWIIVQKR